MKFAQENYFVFVAGILGLAASFLVLEWFGLYCTMDRNENSPG